jgi:hypothetical protein
LTIQDFQPRGNEARLRELGLFEGPTHSVQKNVSIVDLNLIATFIDCLNVIASVSCSHEGAALPPDASDVNLGEVAAELGRQYEKGE